MIRRKVKIRYSTNTVFETPHNYNSTLQYFIHIQTDLMVHINEDIRITNNQPEN